jgi:hypothetical protein
MIVTAELLLSHNDKIGSVIIAEGTKHLVKDGLKGSHISLLVNGRWVHESTGHTGVRVTSIDNFTSCQKIVGRASLGIIDYKALKNKYREIQGKRYDYLGIMFFALAILPTFFGLPLIKKNLLESKNKYFCCEAVGYLTGHYYGMSAPNQVYAMNVKDDGCKK